MAARARTILANAAVALVSIVVVAVLGEAAVRALFKDRTVLFPRYHTDYRYGKYAIRGTRPGIEYWMTSIDGSWKVVTNSKGFRNTREFAIPKPAGALRVLSLGDSNTQGYEVRQEFTFSAVLERDLLRRGRRAEVINAGVSGFSTAEALVFLENEGIRYAPDVVVLGFSANDFEDNVKAGLFALDAGRGLKEEKYEHLPGVAIQNALYRLAFMRWLSENSYLYSMLFNNVWAFFKARLAAETALEAEGATRGQLEYAVPTTMDFSPHQVALAAALIERMSRFCAQQGIRLIVVDIPAFAPSYRSTTSLPPALRARLASAGVELLDSEQLLASYQGVAELHLPNGYHHISEFTHTMIGLELGRRTAR